MHQHIYLEFIPSKLHCTHSFVIQGFTWRNCFGNISWRSHFSYIKSNSGFGIAIRHTIITRTFFIENHLLAKRGNVTHKITPALLTNNSLEALPNVLLCWATRLMRHQHLGITHTHLGYTPDVLWEINFDQNYTKLPRITQKIVGNLIRHNFATKKALHAASSGKCAIVATRPLEFVG